MIKFVSYTGKYPSLCSGILTLEVDGKIVTFGMDYPKMGEYPKFWTSGGAAYFTDNYSESHVYEGHWEYAGGLPEKFEPNAEQFMAVFNENVKHGCCGGCL